ncbi:MAG: hypothetical protein KKF89_04655 [Nanoarchaeota archaeon]|nr:hypothetical protein [Nanoarchaeota archaeon]
MKVAVIGPVTKDVKIIDNERISGMGGIPFYIGNTLKALGVDVTAFVSHGKEDDEWVENNFSGVKVSHIHCEGTLKVTHKFSTKNPDKRDISTTHFKNRIRLDNISNISSFDWISLGPLLNENMDEDFFKSLPKDKVIFNNFGLLNYHEDKKWVYKHPERLVNMVKYFEFMILDEEEVLFATSNKSVVEAVKFLQKKGLRNLAVTKGSRGSTIFIKNRVYEIPAYTPKRFVDTTGCGDTYVAGLIKGLELFDDFQKIGEFAAMVSTMRIENNGPFNKSLEDVYERLNHER